MTTLENTVIVEPQKADAESGQVNESPETEPVPEAKVSMDTAQPTIEDHSNDIRLAECPVCFAEYEDDADHKPMVLLCGHSLCAKCLAQASMIDHKIFFGECHICKQPITETVLTDGTKHKASVGYDILQTNRLLKELKLRSEMEESRKKQKGLELECLGCESVEKTVKMRVCETCLEECGMSRIMDEEMISSYIMCTTCVVDSHLGHKLINYLPWKIQEIARVSSRTGTEVVFGMKQLCESEEKNGIDECNRWIKEMGTFADFDTSAMNYEDAVVLDKLLSEETKTVNQSADGTLLPLRKFSQTVKNSIDKLKKIRERALAGQLLKLKDEEK